MSLSLGDCFEVFVGASRDCIYLAHLVSDGDPLVIVVIRASIITALTLSKFETELLLHDEFAAVFLCETR